LQVHLFNRMKDNIHDGISRRKSNETWTIC
jgi:hypothetical protein